MTYPVETAPLTDEELRELGIEAAHGDTSVNPNMIADGALRLVAEVRRLRALHYDQVLEDIGKLREAVGLPNVALPISPREAMGEAVEVARRLRSDEWLRAAVVEITENVAPLASISGTVEQRLAILKKHRDGKA